MSSIKTVLFIGGPADGKLDKECYSGTQVVSEKLSVPRAKDESCKEDKQFHPDFREHLYREIPISPNFSLQAHEGITDDEASRLLFSKAISPKKEHDPNDEGVASFVRKIIKIASTQCDTVKNE